MLRQNLGEALYLSSSRMLSVNWCESDIPVTSNLTVKDIWDLTVYFQDYILQIPVRFRSALRILL